MKTFSFAILLFAFVLIFAQTSFAAGNIDATFNASVTEGPAFVGNTLTQPDGKIIVIGGFQRANNARQNNITRFNANGSLDTTFNINGSGANSYIHDVALQTDGKILIGGNFTAYNGQAINRLARLNADGSFDATFNPTANFNAPIEDIFVQPNGKILVAGQFNATSGQPLSSRIVRFNADGTIDAGFANNAGMNTGGYILTIAYQTDGKILIGGYFTNFGGVNKSFLARLNNDGTLDNSFASSNHDLVTKIVVEPNGNILIGGDYLFYGVKRLNADGSPTSSLNHRPDATSVWVETSQDIELLPDGNILVAYGSGFGQISAWNTLRLKSDLTIDPSFQSTVPDRFVLRDINPLFDGKFILSGDFVTVNSEKHLRLAQMHSDGSLDTTFNASGSATGNIRAIKRQPDGKILIGGIFEYVNGVRQTNIARLNADGSLDTSFNVSPTVFDYAPANFVYDIELQSDGKIIVGRQRFMGATIALTDSLLFSEGSIIRFNTDGSLDAGFATMPTHLILALGITADDKIFIGGYFENLVTPPYGVETFRKLSVNGDLDTAFTPPVQPSIGSVRDILIQPDGKILIGGTFTNTGGFPSVGTARFNADGTFDAGYSGTIPNIYALGLANDGKIYAGGTFEISGGNPNRNFTRLNANGSTDLSFNANANAFVRDLLVQPDGKIVIGGDFTNYNGNSANRIARVNTDGSIDSSFNTGAGASGSIYALESQTDGKILVGGLFMDFDGVEKLSLLRLQTSLANTPFDFDGDTKTDISIFRPSNGQWWYLRSSDNQNRAFQFGAGTDNIAPADFTGDGKTDIAVFRPASGEWFVMRSEDNSFYSFPFGTSGDVPIPADYDGDTKDDTAVFRPSTQTWYIQKSTGGTTIEQFGASGDLPVPADYDGDGKTDIAIFRPSSGQWWLNRSIAGVIALTFGTATDKPVQGDYTGDGKADVAFWRPSSGEWFVLRSENYSYYASAFGISSDIPTPGDYDGDGKFDLAVFRSSEGNWYLQRSTAGFIAQQFGLSTDKPVPSAFVP